MAEQIYNWAKEQEDDYCTWGFGELAPPSNSTDPSAYVLNKE